MNRPNNGAGTLRVALDRDTALIRVEGRGNFQSAPALREFGELARRKGVRHLVLDGIDCDAMDSTFIGTLVGLANGYRDAGGRVSAVRIGDRLMKTLATLGVDRAIDLRPRAEPPAGIPGDAALPQSTDQSSLKRVIFDAHQTLSDLSDANRAEFRDLMTYLEEELRRSPDARPTDQP